jgi:hypothetical protein
MASSGLSPEEEADREDHRMLSENKKKIESILKLLKETNDREKAEDRVGEAREKTTAMARPKSERVFHEHGGKRVAVTRGASEHLELGDALELHMRTRAHGKDLHKALERAAETRVLILDRIMERGVGLLG